MSTEMSPDVRSLVGPIDFDLEALRERYGAERDVRSGAERKQQQKIDAGADFSHYEEDPYVSPLERAPIRDHAQVTIIGGGLGGILSAVRLRQAGLRDIRIIEKGGDLGGTWYWNRYPGVRCDVESYVYVPCIEEVGSFPSEKYCRGEEIYDHLRTLAAQFDLYDRACLQTGVTGLRWLEEEGRWEIRTDRDDRMTSDFVVMACGIFDRAKLPNIPGIERFAGHTFHTSRWDYGYTGGSPTEPLTGLADKRVGVVGTGATGIQVVPEVAKWSKHTYVFQRTPAAVDVRANRPTDAAWVRSLQPGWQPHRRDNFNHTVNGLPHDADLIDDGFTRTYKLFDSTASWASASLGRPITPQEGAFITEILDHKLMNRIRARIDEIVTDPQTAAALKPWHRRFCKRPLFSDDYLQTFNRPNVTLVNAKRGIERITPRGAVVDGKERELDCLIFATGFDVGAEFTRRAGFDVFGRNGLELSDYWKNGMKTFQGLFTRHFPNCLFVGWGQSGVAVNLSFMLDEQAQHAAYAISETLQRGKKTVEPTEGAVAAYVEEVHPLSFSQLQFWKECTPGFYNEEGDQGNPHGFFANVHPAGTVGFYRMLAQWRDERQLRGLELR